MQAISPERMFSVFQEGTVILKLIQLLLDCKEEALSCISHLNGDYILFLQANVI